MLLKAFQQLNSLVVMSFLSEVIHHSIQGTSVNMMHEINWLVDLPVGHFTGHNLNSAWVYHSEQKSNLVKE